MHISTHAINVYSGGAPTVRSASQIVGLVSGYKCENNTNDVLSTFNGVDTNVSFATGKILQGAYYNGSSETKIGTPHLSASGSFDFWFNSNNVGGGEKRIISDNGGYIYISINEPTAGIGLSFNVYASAIYQLLYPTALSASTWYHVVATWDSTYLNLYINGNLEITVSAGAISALTPLSFGSILGVIYYDGMLDEIYIYNRALTALEVMQFYNSGLGLTY